MTDNCNHCAGLSRSRLLHRAAEAGIGLPSIEPGMPLPAGTGLSRRSFVTQGVGAMLAVYGARSCTSARSRRASQPPRPIPRSPSS